MQASATAAVLRCPLSRLPSCARSYLLLHAILSPSEAATYAVQHNTSGSAAWVLCGLLLILHHQLAT
jgi:hypothetical protein